MGIAAYTQGHPLGITVRFIFSTVLATLLMAGCGHFASVQSPSPTLPSPAEPSLPRRTATPQAQEVVLFSMHLLEQSYKFGGKTPAAGLDCSGLVTYVYKNAVGLRVPGNAAKQAKHGRLVRKTDLAAGDLVFFNTRGAPYSHVGIYIGDDKFIHALSTKHGIRLDKLSSPYFATRFTEARSMLN